MMLPMRAPLGLEAPRRPARSQSGQPAVRWAPAPLACAGESARGEYRTAERRGET